MLAERHLVARGQRELVLRRERERAPDEGRRFFNLAPVPGGKSPMAQQQNYSLAALDKRDSSDDPFRVTKPTSVPDPTDPSAPTDPNTPAGAANNEQDPAKHEAEFFTKAMESFDLEMAA